MSVPEPDGSTIAVGALAESTVTITIADGRQEVSAGQTVRYEVIVRNGGEVEAPLTVKLTVPAGAVTSLEAQDAAVIANAVAWKDIVGAGQARSYSLAGRVEPGAEPRELAVTACVHDRLNAPAVACATDRNELAAAQADDEGARRLAWLGSILFGILAVFGALWLNRKVNPEQLTQANAREIPEMAPVSAAPISAVPISTVPGSGYPDSEEPQPGAERR